MKNSNKKNQKRKCLICKRSFILNPKIGLTWAKKTNRGIFCSKHCFHLYQKGKHFSKKTEFKHGHQLGLNKEVSFLTRKKISVSLRGIKLHEWDGFKSNERQKIIHSKEYISWRKKVFKRDNWSCQNCHRKSSKGISLYLEAHHIKRIKEYPDLIYEVSNGITLCRDCHSITKTRKNKIGIIGSEGFVGSKLLDLVKKQFQIIPYDIIGIGSKAEINKCQLAVICVPTKKNKNGEADISLVEKTVKWLNVPLILIKSTVPPGTTKYLSEKYKKNIAFSPEFAGESTYYHPFWSKMIEEPAIIIGAKDKKVAEDILDFFQPILGPTKTFAITDSQTAELTKYMENVFFATKVIFANEMKKIADIFGVSYYELRELWALDPRVNKMHTSVFTGNYGFGGKCFPKDLSALIEASKKAGYKPEFLEEVQKSNARFRKENNQG